MPISRYSGGLAVQHVVLFYVHNRLSLYILSGSRDVLCVGIASAAFNFSWIQGISL